MLPAILAGLRRVTNWTGIALLEDQDVRDPLVVHAMASGGADTGHRNDPFGGDLLWIQQALRGAVRRFPRDAVLMVVSDDVNELGLLPLSSAPVTTPLTTPTGASPLRPVRLASTAMPTLLALIGAISVSPPCYLVVTRAMIPPDNAPLAALHLTPTTMQAGLAHWDDADVVLLRAAAAGLAVWLGSARRARLLADERSFIATTIHQLRNIATPASGFAQIIGYQTSHGNAPNAETLTRLLNQIDRLSHDIDAMQQATDAQHQTITIVKQPVPLPSMVQEAVAQARLYTARHDISIVDPLPEVVVHIDRERIIHVLCALLHNSITYTPAGGPIRVQATVRREGVVISVTDNGIGIPSDHLASVFEPYYRVPAVVQAGYPGVGLGLYVSQAILRLHGGDIALHSTISMGTTATMVLPVLVDGHS